MYFKIQNEITPSANFIETLLESYGIDNVEEYLNVSEKDLADPSTFKNIKNAANRLIQAYNNKERVGIIVDADADGYTSAAIMYLYLKETLQIECKYYMHDGKEHGIEGLIDQIYNIDLLIVPDAGTNDDEFVNLLKERKIDTLILDHHEFETPATNAIIINSQDNTYPNKYLSGAGVVWQFCRYIDSLYLIDNADKYIDLAAVGIVSDMMSLVGKENHYIVQNGLQHTHNPFISLCVSKANASTNPNLISFYIAPYINAIVRVGTPEEVELLFKAFIDDGLTYVPSTKRGSINGDEECLIEQMYRVATNAKNRQKTKQLKTAELIKTYIFNNNLDSHKVIVVNLNEIEQTENQIANENLNGVIANGLVNYYHLPIFIGYTNSLGELCGSCRCPRGFPTDNFRQLCLNSGYFNMAMGHANAFGFAMPVNNTEDFIQFCDDNFVDYAPNKKYCSINLLGNDLTSYQIGQIIGQISQYNYLWGNDVEEPKIGFSNIVFTKNNINIVGADKSTLQLKYPKLGLTFVKFRCKELVDVVNQSNQSIVLDCIGTMNLNIWGNRATPQIIVQDYEVIENC